MVFDCNVRIFITKLLDSVWLTSVQLLCKFSAKKSFFVAKIGNSVQFAHRILSFNLLINNRVW